jgi:multiple sugar transport system substrate-binding protein
VSGLVNDAFLMQYLAVRGYPAQGDPAEDFLDEASLVAVLQFYQDGASSGVFGPKILDYQTTDDCWQDYISGHGAFTQIGAHRYLTDRDGVQSSAPAPIPAIQGPAAAIGRGWALALVAQDTARQEVAAEFMLQLMDAETNAAWNRAANYLPTRQGALANDELSDSYAVFVGPQLLAARPRPYVANYTQVAAALQEAVEAVLSGALTPEQAATEVMSTAD